MDYIGSRSSRYVDALDMHPDWTQEVLADVDMVALEPDPKSRMGASRFIGHSPSAGRVLVVIAYRDLDAELHGVNAWAGHRGRPADLPGRTRRWPRQLTQS